MALTRSDPPYRWAAAAAIVVLAVYVATLAPTVTFWDAGELIASARILGIPHPPGTPVYVMLAHVWGLLLPVGDYAWRLNLLSAVCGAIAAGCWFLVAHGLFRRTDPDGAPSLALAAGWAAALLAAFNFTTWQNAVEAEVYAVALLTIALAAWTAVRWCAVRATPRGNRLLLVLLFLGAISIGNHLLALLVGPALVALLAVESFTRPLDDPAARAAERGRLAVVAATWLLLIAVGLGSTTLTLATGLLALGAGVVAITRRQGAFAAIALCLVVLGISPYLFLLLRAGQAPFINEADPRTLDALLAVIRRAQYPIRTPLDDPTVFHGPGNPGRTLAILGYQLANYAQYFDWQWARTLADGAITAWPRLVVTLGAVWLGLRGLGRQWRTDRSGWAFTLAFFGVTGLGLVLYMNFKPGPSIGWDRWSELADHEVRERDYFFVASFVGWAVLMAIGLADVIAQARRRWPAQRWTTALLGLAVIPLVLNIGDASRRHGPDATLARDFARALLESVPPGGILFTWGDNDTFPLWHAQAVDGIRPDVTIVCLALAETPWYQRQLRDHVPSPPDRNAMAPVWRDVAVPTWTGPMHRLDDAGIEAFQPQLTDQDYELPLGNGAALQIPRGTPLYAKDMLLLAVVRENAGHRPIAWAASTIQKLYGAPVVQQGLAYVLPIDDQALQDVDRSGVLGPGTSPIDVGVTTRLMDETWQFGRLWEEDLSGLEPNVAAMARTVSLPYTRLGVALLERGDTLGAIRRLEAASHLAPGQPGLDDFIRSLRSP
ncbi:MAG: DUF2723 domain-containing protein [Gemmatimonadales bacterium]